MKILHVRFQNLNSLKGQHHIDLENGPLVDAGIYAITGPTGAGKSTILDAITLALFGKAARYENEASPEEIMTRGQSECSAEVTFECGKGRYTASWSRARAHKNPDGNFQQAKRQIAETDSGEIKAEKVREADEVIESLTGLDYERFLRSVLLAQGRFKEFLDAKDNKRGELLEKITGTEIYSKISERCFRLHDEKRSAIKNAQLRIEGFQLKSEEELEQIKAVKTEKKQRVIKLKSELTSAENALRNFTQHQDAVKTIEDDRKKLSQVEEQEKEFGPSYTKLQRHRDTQPFRESLGRLQHMKENKEKLIEERNSFQADLLNRQQTAAAQLKATIDFLNNQLRHADKAAMAARQEKEKITQKLDELSEKLKKIASDKAIADVLPELDTAGEDCRRIYDRLKDKEKQSTEVAKKLKTSTDKVKSNAGHVKEAEEDHQTKVEGHKAAENKFNQMAGTRSLVEWKTKYERISEALDISKELKNSREQWGRIESQIKEQKSLRPDHVRKLEAAEKSRDHQLKELDRERESLKDKQQLQQQALLIASLEEHRDRLEDGKKCPLCGALDHPYAKMKPSLDAKKNQLETDRQQERVSDTEVLLDKANEQLTKNKTQLDELDKSINSLKKQLRAQAGDFKKTAQKAHYDGVLDNESAFTAWFDKCKRTEKDTRSKLNELNNLDSELKNARTAEEKAQLLLEASKKQLHTSQESAGQLAENLQKLKDGAVDFTTQLGEQLKEFNRILAPFAQPISAATGTKSCTDALKAREREYSDTVKKESSCRQELRDLENNIKDLGNNQASLKNELEQWKRETSKLNYSGILSDEIPSPAISEDAYERDAACDAAMKSVNEATQALVLKKKDIDAVEQDLTSQRKKLEVRLQDSSFDSIENLIEAHLPTEEVNNLEEAQKELKELRDTLNGRIQKSEESLKRLEEIGVPSQEELRTLKEKQQAQVKEQDHLQKELGALQKELDMDMEARKGQKQQLEQVEKMQKGLRPWTELNRLIGSANGDRFSKYAQGLTLDQLLLLANDHLLELNDRYQIQREEGESLGLKIIDGYQADAIRSTRSLSGGESFLVSLALALGLSDLAGSDTRIESLFIDEGFGTLDSDTLDTALAALEALRMENRTIGIISHVDALKQRLSAQIRVSKSSTGYGRIEITQAGDTQGVLYG